MIVVAYSPTVFPSNVALTIPSCPKYEILALLTTPRHAAAKQKSFLVQTKLLNGMRRLRKRFMINCPFYVRSPSETSLTALLFPTHISLFTY